MWSIGIYEGDSPLSLLPCKKAENPVMRADMVTDADAHFVADPFMIKNEAGWFLFFEVFNKQSGKGEIGVATSPNGLSWTYRNLVLREPFHLSYPYVFVWKGHWYMVPECFKAGSIRLYRAEAFPEGWLHIDNLLEGSFADPSLVNHEGHWYLFACREPEQHETLRLYSAVELSGPWVEHPRSPLVVGNRRKARPAGRVVSLENHLIRFAQDSYPEYGSQVRGFKIHTLTPLAYEESELSGPILRGSGRGWNAARMHHVDPHLCSVGRWLACVDGFSAAQPGLYP